MRKADHFFFALNNDFSLISKIAAKGHGNGEFMAPLYCDQHVEESGKEYVYILERPKRKLYKVALDESEQNECVFEIPMSWNIEPSFLFLHGKDSCLGVNSLHSCNFLWQICPKMKRRNRTLYMNFGNGGGYFQRGTKHGFLFSREFPRSYGVFQSSGDRYPCFGWTFDTICFFMKM